MLNAAGIAATVITLPGSGPAVLLASGTVILAGGSNLATDVRQTFTGEITEPALASLLRAGGVDPATAAQIQVALNVAGIAAGSALATREIFRQLSIRSTSLVNNSDVAVLKASSVKFTEAELVATTRTPSGQVVFLETGDAKRGLTHILGEHGTHFSDIGVSAADIPSVLMRAIHEGNIVGYQGVGQGRPIYEIILNGSRQRIAITIGSNGFIVGANPAGRLPL